MGDDPFFNFKMVVQENEQGNEDSDDRESLCVQLTEILENIME